jgi:putative transcriptional regulator
MSAELERFKRDLLKSVKQMRRGDAARVTRVKVPEAVEARARTGLSLEQFAQLLGVSPRTLQDWEQSRRERTGAAKTLRKAAVGKCRRPRPPRTGNRCAHGASRARATVAGDRQIR